MDQLYGIGRVAALLGVHPETIRRWERQGKIRVLRTPGGTRRIPESEIRRLRGEALTLPQRVRAIDGARLFPMSRRPREIWTAGRPPSRSMAGQGFDRIIEVTDVASGLLGPAQGRLRGEL